MCLTASRPSAGGEAMIAVEEEAKTEEAAAHAEAEERAAEAAMAEAATQIAATRRRRNSVEMTKKLNLSVDGQGGGEPDWRNRSC